MQNISLLFCITHEKLLRIFAENVNSSYKIKLHKYEDLIHRHHLPPQNLPPKQCVEGIKTRSINYIIDEKIGCSKIHLRWFL